MIPLKIAEQSGSGAKAVKKRSKMKSVIKSGLTGVALATGFTGILAGLSNYASPDRFAARDDIAQQFAIVETDGGTYYGSIVESIYTGQGEFNYLDGGTYVGMFSESKREGEGTYTWPNGDMATGLWSDDQIVEGTYQFADGAMFSGCFSSASFDEGIFDLGTSCEAKGFTSFKATIVDGKLDSIDFSLPDGTRYKGELTGEAEITYPSGNKYSGHVASGYRSGAGTFKWIEGAATAAYYEGSWSRDQMSGRGEYHFGASLYPYISGNFVDGRPDGTATYYKEAGNTFETTWSNGTCTSVKET